MKNKRLLRFYFKVEDLDRALNNLILKHACASADHTRDPAVCAEKIFSLIAAKDELSSLWNYINGVMERLSERERAVLEEYGLSRRGLGGLNAERQRTVKTVLMKFTRHARFIERHGFALRLVGEYYCFMSGK